MRDTLIIGAGPAGLTAATYLGRFHRQALVIDGNESRARWIPESQNIPGFPQGIAGRDLLLQLRAQALRYGAELRVGRVEALRRVGEGFAVDVGGETLISRAVLLATGVRDHLPAIEGAAEAVLRSLLRVCPICDAFEASGLNIAVIGTGDHAQSEAEFLRTYSDRITLIHIGDNLDPAVIERLRTSRIELLESTLEQLVIENDALLVRARDGVVHSFDVFYSALGCAPQNTLAVNLGAELDENNLLRVNAHQRTSVPGLYAAGDVVRGLNQVVVAAAEAAVAATDIHNSLRKA